ncbi:arsenical efflux pump membrane protein ArsB [Symbiobacterium terraclitae]|uniref:arsenical efflux pump membrane protein ArsB n=1 Tax=Symbiobacterium terraclitae TaxID=557451 RepID=UPI0035B52FA1
MATILTPAAIFAGTLYLVIRRPRNLNTGISALLGALLALLAGAITLADVQSVVGIVWDATLALVAIMIISALLEQAGFFRWAALHMARHAGGSGRGVFVAVILLATAVSAFFTNDATVLIVTPIVLEMAEALGFGQRSFLPFAMACGFIADAMSIPLAVSNLTNMIVARFFDLSFARFALVMLLPSLACLLVTTAVLLWYYRREIPRRVDVSGLASPAAAIRDPFLFRVGMAVVSGMVLAFLLNRTLFEVPTSLVMSAGAILLLLASFRNRVVEPWRAIRQAPWHVVAFAVGMYLVVFAVGKAGLTDLTARALQGLAGHGLGITILGTGVLVALLSAAMNNLPGVLVGTLAVAATGATGLLGEGMVMATVIGADIGPKLTPIGSLATLMWLHTLQGRGLTITWGAYLRSALVITPPVLLATLAALWAGLQLII